MALAVRAEYVKGKPRKQQSWQEANDYHNAAHYMHVMTMANYLFDVTIQQPSVRLCHIGEDKKADVLTRADRLRVILRAIIHDLDHPGVNNPANNRTYNEDRSMDIATPILQACGISDAEIRLMKAANATTSPNEMIAGLKAALEEINKDDPSLEWFEQHAKTFTEMAALIEGDDLTIIQKHLEMAAIVNDADLYASAGAGVEANKFMSKILTLEIKKAGVDIDLTTDAARKGFCENVVGKCGFGSRAGDFAFNEAFFAMLRGTLTRIEMDPKKDAYASANLPLLS